MHIIKYIYCLAIALCLCIQIDGNRVKRRYAMCPPDFRRIGNVCYFISENRTNWLSAHFECRDRKSQLAEPIKLEDRYLRKYLNHLSLPTYDELWIGGIFNWERNKWQWGYDAKEMTYQSFSRMPSDRQSLKFHCAIMKASFKFRWSSTYCSENRIYICQHRMPYVSAENRQKIYNRWNQTYPNQMANEIEISPYEDDLLRKRNSIRHKPNPSNNRHRAYGYQTDGQKNINDGRQANILPIYNASWTKSPPYGFQQTRVGPLNHQANRPARYRGFQLAGHQTGGIRNRIQFDDIKNSTKPRMKQRKPNGWKHQPIKKPISLPSTTYDPVRFVPVNDSNQDRQANIAQNAQERRQLDERSRQDEEQKRIDRDRHDAIKRNEEQRYEEKRHREEREKHEKELEDRNAKIEAQRRKQQEEDRLREQGELQRKELEEQQRRQLDEQRRRKMDGVRSAELEQRRELELQRYRDEQIQAQHRRAHAAQQKPIERHEIQTNEILDSVETSPTTTESPLQKKLRLRQNLKNLSPEKLQQFIRKREEKMKGKKRETTVE